MDTEEATPSATGAAKKVDDEGAQGEGNTTKPTDITPKAEASAKPGKKRLMKTKTLKLTMNIT